MRKIVLVILAVVISLFAFYGCGSGKTTEKQVDVNEWVNLSELYKTGDGINNTEFTGEASPIINAGSVLFTKIGQYVLIHQDGSKTEITVKDKAAPQISVDYLTFDPVPNQSHDLPKITVMDGYDGEITDYSVKIDGQETASVTFTEYGRKTMTVTATDASGNKAEKSFPIECLPESEIMVTAGQTVTLGKEFFYGLNDSKSYGYSFTIIKVNGTDRTEIKYQNQFTAESGHYYEVYGKAMSADGTETVNNYKLYREEGVKMLTFSGKGNGKYSATERDFYLVYEVFTNENGQQLVTSPAYSRVCSTDGTVNGKLAISSADASVWAWRFALKGENRSGYLYFDVSFEKDEEEWLFEVVKDTEILHYGDAGRYKVRIDADDGKSDISYRFGANGPKLTENTVYLDNILFVPD